MRYREGLSLLLVGVAGAMWLSALSCAKDGASPASESAEPSAADPTVTSAPLKEVTLEVLGMS